MLIKSYRRHKAGRFSYLTNETSERNVSRLHEQTKTKVKNKMNFNRDKSNFQKIHECRMERFGLIHSCDKSTDYSVANDAETVKVVVCLPVTGLSTRFHPLWYSFREHPQQKGQVSGE